MDILHLRSKSLLLFTSSLDKVLIGVKGTYIRSFSKSNADKQTLLLRNMRVLKKKVLLPVLITFWGINSLAKGKINNW